MENINSTSKKLKQDSKRFLKVGFRAKELQETKKSFLKS